MLYWLSQLSDGGDIFNLFRYITFRAGGAFFTALVFGFIFGRPLINALRRKYAGGQPIRDDGPAHHIATKAGTPTMGGLLILAALTLSTLLWARLDNPYVWMVLGVTVAFGLIGFADDWAKVSRRDSKGVSGRVRLALGFVIAAVAALIAVSIHPDELSARLAFPVFKDVLLNMGWFFVPFAMIVIVGSANAVNLTDGLDGLAIMPVMIAAGTLGVIAYAVGRVDFTEYLDVHYVPGTGELLIFTAGLIGGGLGFLWYNAPPAAVFMGDTGSLALGGALGAIAVATKHEIVLAIVGGLFVAEAVSVIIQVPISRHRQARLPHGADPPPFRETGLGRAADRHPLLDHLADPRADRAGDAEAALMPEPVRDRAAMIRAMAPERRDGTFIFATLTGDRAKAAAPRAIASFAEEEGLSLVLPLAEAEALGLDTALPMACLTLRVHSALDGVGLTAAVASALAEIGIPCNMVAAFHHDHAFVPEAQAEAALACLKALARSEA
jgi:phospho-N-acetylmuramoyl-pentapeptide-transferase